MTYTHKDDNGMLWRFNGSRPISKLADEIMEKLKMTKWILPSSKVITSIDTSKDIEDSGWAHALSQRFAVEQSLTQSLDLLQQLYISLRGNKNLDAHQALLVMETEHFLKQFKDEGETGVQQAGS